MYLSRCMRCSAGSWSSNFIIGLTNVSPNVSRPTLWNYTLCGQYPGTVPNGATVTVYCNHNPQQFRYVIVQLPSTKVPLNICELQVFVKSTWMTRHCMLYGVVILSVRFSVSSPLLRILLNPIYTIQKVVLKPVEQPFRHPVECLYMQYTRLFNRLSNQLKAGWTTACIAYTIIQPVVQPVVQPAVCIQPVWFMQPNIQQITSCKHTTCYSTGLITGWTTVCIM